MYAGAAPGSSDLAAALASRLDAADPALTTAFRDRDALRRVYRERDYRPIWHDGLRKNALATEWLETLQEASARGLAPGDYHLAALRERWDTDRTMTRVESELLLTDAFLDYADHLHRGRTRPAPESEWQVPDAPPVEALAASLESAERLREVLSNLAPTHSDYRRLQSALERYREIEARGGWPDIHAGYELARGKRDRRVPLLRQYLTSTGDLDVPPSTEDPLWFDEGLDLALRRFQARHGLAETGSLDERTRAALNVPVETRIRQIATSLERMRWMPRELGDRYVLINMTSFMLEGRERERQLLSMRVIIGRPYRATPMISSRFTHVTLNPDWTVPYRMAVEDLLPMQVQDPDFLSRKNIRVFRHGDAQRAALDPATIDWTVLDFDHFPYELRQDPGPGNSLGRIKFHMPNRHQIYVHDTPVKRLFSLPVRTFSAGCIRAEEPLDLAAFLLADPRWPASAIEAEIERGATRAIALPEPVPVYLVYWTAWVTPEGAVQFRNDVYDSDHTSVATGRRVAGEDNSTVPQGPHEEPLSDAAHALPDRPE